MSHDCNNDYHQQTPTHAHIALWHCDTMAVSKRECIWIPIWIYTYNGRHIRHRPIQVKRPKKKIQTHIHPQPGIWLFIWPTHKQTQSHIKTFVLTLRRNFFLLFFCSVLFFVFFFLFFTFTYTHCFVHSPFFCFVVVVVWCLALFCALMLLFFDTKS